MNLKELRESFESHVKSVSTEQFEKELIEAGIESCPDAQEIPMVELPTEILIVASVYEHAVFWGDTIYSKSTKGVNVEGNARRVA